MVNDAILRGPVKKDKIASFRDACIGTKDPLSLIFEVLNESAAGDLL